MRTLYDLMSNCNIQGAYIIKVWSDEQDTAITLAEGSDFECESHKLSAYITDSELKYMYAVDGVLNIEIEMDEEKIEHITRQKVYDRKR